MQAKEQVPAHSKILPAQIWLVDGLKNHCLFVLLSKSVFSTFSMKRNIW